MVNASGTFLLGLLFAMATERAILPAEVRGPLMIGFLGELVGDGLITLEKVEVIAYRGRGLADSPPAPKPPISG